MKKTEERWRERGPRPPGIDRGDPYGQFPPSFTQITPKYKPNHIKESPVRAWREPSKSPSKRTVRQYSIAVPVEVEKSSLELI